MCWPVRPWPLTFSKETARKLCKTGIAHFVEIFFVENADYYKKLISKAVKKMGLIYLDNPVEIHNSIWKELYQTIDHIDYVEGIAVCAFRDYRNKIDSLNCYDTKSIVAVGRELVRTLNNRNVRISWI